MVFPFRRAQPITYKRMESMKKAIIGKKVGMAQIFDENGRVIPVTVIEAGPCVVVQKKSAEKEGYESLQLGFEDIAERKLSKGEAGHLAKADAAPKRILKEFKLEDSSEFSVGDILKADVFTEGDRVDVTGVSKGKGTTGVIKRWGFAIQRRSHGGGPIHRHRGSLGAAATPSKVMPGSKMAGRVGGERVTVQNLDVVKVDADLNLIAVRGAVPGPKGGIVSIKSTSKAR